MYSVPVSRLQTPRVQYSGPACVSFYYHMSGQAVGRLSVYTRQGQRSPQFDMTGDQGTEWRRGQVQANLATTDQVSERGQVLSQLFKCKQA